LGNKASKKVAPRGGKRPGRWLRGTAPAAAPRSGHRGRGRLEEPPPRDCFSPRRGEGVRSCPSREGKGPWEPKKPDARKKYLRDSWTKKTLNSAGSGKPKGNPKDPARPKKYAKIMRYCAILCENYAMFFEQLGKTAGIGKIPDLTTQKKIS